MDRHTCKMDGCFLVMMLFFLLFVNEVCMQYKFWAHLFNESTKRHFIPLPWKIGEIMVKNITHINKIWDQFDHFNLKKENEIKGFYPKQLFMKHMTLVRYIISFSNTFSFRKEEGDSQNPQILPNEKRKDDAKTIINITSQHRQ